jgi:hypothetical protein
MATFKTKVRKGFGAPPASSDTKNNLEHPDPLSRPTRKTPKVEQKVSNKVDGRSLRRTGRTVQFNKMVRRDFRDQFAKIAKRDRLMHTELLEVTLAAYEQWDKEEREALIESVFGNEYDN